MGDISNTLLPLPLEYKLMMKQQHLEIPERQECIHLTEQVRTLSDTTTHSLDLTCFCPVIWDLHCPVLSHLQGEKTLLWISHSCTCSAPVVYIGRQWSSLWSLVLQLNHPTGNLPNSKSLCYIYIGSKVIMSEWSQKKNIFSGTVYSSLISELLTIAADSSQTKFEAVMWVYESVIPVIFFCDGNVRHWTLWMRHVIISWHDDMWQYIYYIYSQWGKVL